MNKVHNKVSLIFYLFTDDEFEKKKLDREVHCVYNLYFRTIIFSNFMK